MIDDNDGGGSLNVQRAITDLIKTGVSGVFLEVGATSLSSVILFIALKKCSTL